MLYLGRPGLQASFSCFNTESFPLPVPPIMSSLEVRMGLHFNGHAGLPSPLLERINYFEIECNLVLLSNKWPQGWPIYGKLIACFLSEISSKQSSAFAMHLVSLGKQAVLSIKVSYLTFCFLK